jgi:very-short-patch-repair endonuclease
VKNDMPLIERAISQRHLLRRTDVDELGVAPEQWRRWFDEGRWLEVTPGLFRHAATPLTFRMQIDAGSRWIGKRGALYGRSALAWLELLPGEPERVEFLIARSRRSIPNWLTIHTTDFWDRGDVVSRDGVRTCTATRALIDFAATMPTATELEALIDLAISRRLTALPRLRQRLAALSGRGRPGSVLMRELLLDSGGESHLERRFLRLLRVSGFGRPQCQVQFKAGSERVARVDFYYPEHRVVIEVSGRLGHTSDRDRQRDARRRNALQQAGETVLEFTTADVIDATPYVLRTLATSLPVIP